MWSPMHFDDILNKVKGLQEPTVQTSTGGSCMCNQAQQEKGTFQRLKIYKHDSAQQWLKKGSVIWQFWTPTKIAWNSSQFIRNSFEVIGWNSGYHKERTAEFAPTLLPTPPPSLPPLQKEWSPAPALQKLLRQSCYYYYHNYLNYHSLLLFLLSLLFLYHWEFGNSNKTKKQ